MAEVSLRLLALALVRSQKKKLQRLSEERELFAVFLILIFNMFCHLEKKEMHLKLTLAVWSHRGHVCSHLPLHARLLLSPSLAFVQAPALPWWLCPVDTDGPLWEACGKLCAGPDQNT